MSADLITISNDLGLRPLEQEWGLLNADPIRVKEFLAYAMSKHDQMDSGTKAEVLDLILESICRDDGDAALDGDTEDKLDRLLNVMHIDADTLEYWHNFIAARASPARTKLLELLRRHTRPS